MCSQNLTLLHYVYNRQSPITPTNYVQWKWLVYNPTNNEHILSYCFRGVAFTKSHGQMETVTTSLCRRAWGVKNKYTNLDMTTYKSFCREALTLCTDLFMSIYNSLHDEHGSSDPRPVNLCSYQNYLELYKIKIKTLIRISKFKFSFWGLQ